SLRERARVGVIVGQPVDHRLQSHHAGRRKHAGLAHAAAQSLAPPPRLVDRLLTAEKHAPGRTAEAFREAKRHRVAARGDVGDITPRAVATGWTCTPLMAALPAPSYI